MNYLLHMEAEDRIDHWYVVQAYDDAHADRLGAEIAALTDCLCTGWTRLGG